MTEHDKTRQVQGLTVRNTKTSNSVFLNFCPRVGGSRIVHGQVHRDPDRVDKFFCDALGLSWAR
jgi:hypothetical protein